MQVGAFLEARKTKVKRIPTVLYGRYGSFFACYYTLLTLNGLHSEIWLELFVWTQSSGTHF